MTRLRRCVLALVSLTSGGVIGTTTPALAAPTDPVPSTPPPTVVPPAPPSTPTRSPAPALVPDVVTPVLTGRAVPTLPVDPSRIVAAATTTLGVQTGRAADRPTPAPPAAASAAPTPTAARPDQPPPGSRGDAPTPAAPTPPVAPTPAAPAPRPSGSTRTTSSPAGPTAAPPPASLDSPSDIHIVVTGDSLWSVATARVAATSGRSPTAVSVADVTPYWLRLCDANRSRLRSGDLNLIYPGEQLALPAIGG